MRIREPLIQCRCDREAEPKSWWELPEKPQVVQACKGSFALLRMTDR
jgi:hypothetical protein